MVHDPLGGVQLVIVPEVELTKPFSHFIEPLPRPAIGCENEPKVFSDKDELKKVEYSSKTSGPTLSVIYIDGHGHRWPGGKAVLPDSIMGPNTKTLDATDTIWEFFNIVSASNSQTREK